MADGVDLAAGGFGGTAPGSASSPRSRSEPVQKELALTEDQKTKVKTLVDEYQTASREAMQGLFGRGDGERPSEEERAKRTAEFREKTDKLMAEKKPALAAVISADQMTRLEQIVLQAKGGEALNRQGPAGQADGHRRAEGQARRR